MINTVKRGKFNASLEIPVIKALKIASAKSGKSGSDIIQELLKDHLEEEIELAIAS